MPLRARARPKGTDLLLYRRIAWGRLASLHMLDTRQYRTDQPCGDKIQPPCAERSNPAATMLGAAQQKWLFDGLARSQAQWNVLAPQVIMAQLDVDPGPGERFPYVRGLRTEYEDSELRHRMRDLVSNTRLERLLRNRYHDSNQTAVTLGGTQTLPGSWQASWRGSYSKAVLDTPYRIESTFRQTGATFAPNVSAGVLDPANVQANPQNQKRSIPITRACTPTPRCRAASRFFRARRRTWGMRRSGTSGAGFRAGSRSTTRAATFSRSAALPPMTTGSTAASRSIIPRATASTNTCGLSSTC